MSGDFSVYSPALTALGEVVDAEIVLRGDAKIAGVYTIDVTFAAASVPGTYEL